MHMVEAVSHHARISLLGEGWIQKWDHDSIFNFEYYDV